MKKKMFCCIIFFVVTCSSLFSNDTYPLPSKHSFEKLVSELVEIQNQVSVEKSSWNEKKNYLNQEINLLKEQKKVFAEKIKKTNAYKKTFENEYLTLINQKKKYTKAIERTLPIIKNIESEMYSYISFIPKPLKINIEKLYNDFKNSNHLSFSKRLQKILTISNELLRLESNIHVVREVIITNDNKEKEFDVIYLGMSQGYCVSNNLEHAGIGIPSKNGWMWKWDKQMGLKIKKAVEIYKKERTAEFVELPIQPAQ